MVWETILLMAQGGSGNRRKADELVSRGLQIANHIEVPHAQGWNNAANAYRFWCEGSFDQAVRYAEIAESIYREQCTGVTWELGSLIAWCQLPAMIRQGQLRAVRSQYSKALREFSALGDRYTQTVLKTYVEPWLSLADDQAEGIVADTNAVLSEWSDGPWQLQHYCTWIAQMRAACYQGNGEAAVELYQKHHKDYRKAMQNQLEIKRVFVDVLLGQAAVISRNPKHLGLAQQVLTRLKKETLSWAKAHALALQAAIHCRREQLADSQHGYEAAARAFSNIGMPMHAAACSAQLDEEARNQALTSIAEVGVRNPAQFVSALIAIA